MQCIFTSGVRWLVLCAMASSVACASAVDGGEDVDAVISELPKGTPGAQVGQGNYCDNPAALCTAGEGDCDSNTQCEAGLVCGRSKLSQFGPSNGDACVPAHCVNEVRDGDETQIDCGGSCGTNCAPPACLPIGPDRCNSDCLCAVGEGDCDSNEQCQASLVCGRGKLGQFASISGDACVPAHCVNEVRDGDETQIDCGGSCGTTCAPPVCLPIGPDRCTTDCLCGVGEGDCDSPDECQDSLVCGRGKLSQFGSISGDACVPAHCVNEVRDGDETQIDCGGSCGTQCAPPTCLPTGPERCSTDCPCGIGEGDCDANIECEESLVCAREALSRYVPIAGDACVPAHCVNGVQDAGETTVDCGGECGSLGCPAVGCVEEGATYLISVDATYRAKWPKHGHREWGACASFEGAYDLRLRATVVGESVKLEGWGYAGTYPIVEQSAAGFTVRAGSLDGEPYRCGNAIPGWDNRGEVTLIFSCEDGSVRFDATCSSNHRGDGCRPNYWETASGSGAKVDGAAE